MTRPVWLGRRRYALPEPTVPMTTPRPAGVGRPTVICGRCGTEFIWESHPRKTREKSYAYCPACHLVYWRFVPRKPIDEGRHRDESETIW